MTLLSGCSQTCTPVATVGHYSLKSGADMYELSLMKDGSGSLSRNGKREDITWEWVASSEQVFLHMSRELLENLSALTGRPTPLDAAPFRSGYFGLDPKCRSGLATELALGEDAAHFVRQPDH